MALVGKGELRDMVLRAVPRLRKPAALPTDDKSLKIQANLRELARESLKKLGR